MCIRDSIASEAPVQVVYPEEGTYCSPGALAIIKDCPNQMNAQKFVDFIQGSKIQDTLAGINKRSSRTDVVAGESMKPLDEVPKMDYQETWAEEHKDEFVEFWKDLVTE